MSSKQVEYPLETAFRNLSQHMQDLEETPNDSLCYYFTIQICENLGDNNTLKSIWPILYPTHALRMTFTNSFVTSHNDIKEIPHHIVPTRPPPPPAPVIDVTPVATVMEKKMEDFKRETVSSLNSFADTIKASPPKTPSPSAPLAKMDNSTRW